MNCFARDTRKRTDVMKARHLTAVLKAGDRFERYKRAMMIVCGFDFTEKEKSRAYVDCRTVVAWKLHEDGFTTGIIGSLMDKEHSSIVQYLRRMDNALEFPNAWKDLITLKGWFEKKLEYYDSDRD